MSLAAALLWLAASAGAAVAPSASRGLPVPRAVALPPSVAAQTGLGSVPELPASAVAVSRAIVPALPEDAAWLSSVLETAQRSASARVVLADVAALAARRGQPVVVAALPTSEAGAFDWTDDVVWMRAGLKKKPLPAAAATLIHELRHVVQKEWALPFDAAELELDAYVVDFSVSRELGDKRPMDKYDARANRAFKGGVRSFQRFLQKEYPHDLWLGRSVDTYAANVQALRAEEVASAERLRRRLEDKRKVARAMERAGYSARSLEAFAAAELRPLAARLEDLLSAIAWRDRDLELLSSPAARRRYADFARDARKRAGALARRLRGR